MFLQQLGFWGYKGSNSTDVPGFQHCVYIVLVYCWTQKIQLGRFGLLSDAIVPSANVGNIFLSNTLPKTTFDLKSVLLHKASSANSSDTCLNKSWWMYKKQYQTIVELNTVRGTVPSRSFAAAILILPDRGKKTLWMWKVSHAMVYFQRQRTVSYIYLKTVH